MFILKYLISFPFLASGLPGCSAAAFVAEEAADEVIEKEIVPEVEKELKKEIEKEAQKKSAHPLPRYSGHSAILT